MCDDDPAQLVVTGEVVDGGNSGNHGSREARDGAVGSRRQRGSPRVRIRSCRVRAWRDPIEKGALIIRESELTSMHCLMDMRCWSTTAGQSGPRPFARGPFSARLRPNRSRPPTSLDRTSLTEKQPAKPPPPWSSASLHVTLCLPRQGRIFFQTSPACTTACTTGPNHE